MSPTLQPSGTDRKGLVERARFADSRQSSTAFISEGVAICPLISARARPARTSATAAEATSSASACRMRMPVSCGPDCRFRTDQQWVDPAPFESDGQGLDHGWIIGTGDGDGSDRASARW